MNVHIPPAVVARVPVEDVLFMALVHGLEGLEDRLRQEVARGAKEA